MMVVQELAEFAEKSLPDALENIAWHSKPVPWLLEISLGGRFLGAISRSKPKADGKKDDVAPLGRVARSPVNRNNGHHPLIGADEIGYVLGPGEWTSVWSEYEKQRAHHEAFVELLRRAAREMRSAFLRACIRFYDDPTEVDRARAAFSGARPGSVISLSVQGPVVERRAVQTFWKLHYEAALSQRTGKATGECLVSGQLGPILPTHERVKGVAGLGGEHSGAALMSFDKDAFCSYGWEQNQNSPVSPKAAMAYVLALNHLLSPENRHRRDIGGIGFLSWMSRKLEFDWYTWLDAADPGEIALMSGYHPRARRRRTRFYMAGISANGGRLRLHYWVTDSLARVKMNLRDWHEQLRLEWPWADSPPTVRFRQIEQAVAGHGSTPGYCTLALVRRAIEGAAQPLGLAILARALHRLRRTQVSDMVQLRVAAGLIRLCLNDVLGRQKAKRSMTEIGAGLDPAWRVPAYVCGRLMAEYESLQRASSGDANASVVDRYFDLASTFPGAAFPRVEELGLRHLRILQRENAAAAYAIGKRLTELHHQLELGRPYPARLNLEEQGLFVLGYYHQKARSLAQAVNRRPDQYLSAQPGMGEAG